MLSFISLARVCSRVCSRLTINMAYVFPHLYYSKSLLLKEQLNEALL